MSMFAQRLITGLIVVVVTAVQLLAYRYHWAFNPAEGFTHWR
jgi:hypothetical protein